jgi:hypothetical protein
MAQLPWHQANHTLTGNLRVRIGWFGRIILQVEEQYQMVQRWTFQHPVARAPGYIAEEVGSTNTRWRDATITDIQQISPMRLDTRKSSG